ncbi:MAG: hypothetical protein JWQ10_2747 [Herbaspirillum sp.]|nr:hypothetical protein [Herbaspirillum sp.]
MMPANQGFGADDITDLAIDLRLIKKFKFLVRQSTAQAVPDFPPIGYVQNCINAARFERKY